jgi:hypothetical protein
VRVAATFIATCSGPLTAGSRSAARIARDILRAIDHHVNDYITCARLRAAPRETLSQNVCRAKFELPGPLTEVHHQVAGLTGGPGPGRMSGDAQDVHRPCLDLRSEQHVHAPQQHGVGMQEVARQDGECLAGQELPPGRRRPPWCSLATATAAGTARSAQSGRGRATCRRKTATSCRSTRISASLAASLRVSSVSQPATRTMNR